MKNGTDRWLSRLRDRRHRSKHNQWIHEAGNDGSLNGNGKCAKRLRRLAKKDLKTHALESHREAKAQLGPNLWKHGVIGLAPVGKPRGVKKAAQETIQ